MLQLKSVPVDGTGTLKNGAFDTDPTKSQQDDCKDTMADGNI